MKNQEKMTPLKRRFLAAVAFGVASFFIAPAGNFAAQWQRENQPALNAGELGELAGQGAMLGIFGGLRSLLADIAWVRAYFHWENSERAANESLMRLAITLDPDNAYFWINTADTIGYDHSHWEINLRSHRKKIPLDPLVETAIHQEYAEKGVTLLETGAIRSPKNQSQFYHHAAQICTIRLKDFSRAAEYYRRAAECPNPRWFSGVIYMEITANILEKKSEAIEWGKNYLKKLDEILPDDPYDTRGSIREKIEELETK